MYDRTYVANLMSTHRIFKKLNLLSCFKIERKNRREKERERVKNTTINIEYITVSNVMDVTNSYMHNLSR